MQGPLDHTIGRPPRDELPYELPSHRALAFGDTVIEVDGELRVWPRKREMTEAWYEERFHAERGPRSV